MRAVGEASGRGLIAAMRRIMPAWLLRALVALVVAANTLNIAADVTRDVGVRPNS